MTDLNDKQARFVAEYLIDLNGKQAAIRAGYSLKTAEVQASRLLSLDKVQAAVQAGQAKLAEKSGISAERVLAEFERIAFADPRAVMSWGPDGVVLRDSTELTAAEAAIISEVSETKEGMRVKLNSKLTALSELGKHLGLFKDRVELTGRNGGPIETTDLTGTELARRIAFALARAARATTKD